MAPRSKEQFETLRSKSREKILMASLELFAGKTYHNTSISDIAEKAGVSKGLIYNYFDTKEDILKGIIDYLMQIGDKMFAEAAKYPDPKAELKALIDMVFVFLDQQSTLNRMMIPLALETGSFEYINTVVEEKMRGYMQKLIALFAEIGVEDPENEAWMMGIFFDGLALDHAIMGDALPKVKLQQYLYKKYAL